MAMTNHLLTPMPYENVVLHVCHCWVKAMNSLLKSMLAQPHPGDATG